jgi:hypothetical protein
MLLLLLSIEGFIKVRSLDHLQCLKARLQFRENRLIGSKSERGTLTEHDDLLSLLSFLKHKVD